jgi:hypothetical protein
MRRHRVTTQEQDEREMVRFCRHCEEPCTPDLIDWDQYDYYSDLGEIVVCRACSDERREAQQ